MFINLFKNLKVLFYLLISKFSSFSKLIKNLKLPEVTAEYATNTKFIAVGILDSSYTRTFQSKK